MYILYPTRSAVTLTEGSGLLVLTKTLPSPSLLDAEHSITSVMTPHKGKRGWLQNYVLHNTISFHSIKLQPCQFSYHHWPSLIQSCSFWWGVLSRPINLCAMSRDGLLTLTNLTTQELYHLQVVQYVTAACLMVILCSPVSSHTFYKFNMDYVSLCVGLDYSSD